MRGDRSCGLREGALGVRGGSCLRCVRAGKVRVLRWGTDEWSSWRPGGPNTSDGDLACGEQSCNDHMCGHDHMCGRRQPSIPQVDLCCYDLMYITEYGETGICIQPVWPWRIPVIRLGRVCAAMADVGPGSKFQASLGNVGQSVCRWHHLARGFGLLCVLGR